MNYLLVTKSVFGQVLTKPSVWKGFGSQLEAMNYLKAYYPDVEFFGYPDGSIEANCGLRDRYGWKEYATFTIESTHNPTHSDDPLVS